jgi:hypothetical protein
MKEKTNKLSAKKNAGFCSVRIRMSSKERAAALLLACNKKKSGRKVKFDELFELAISQVADEQVKLLQERSLTHEDRKEILRQKYIEARGAISKDEFTGFMMTQEFLGFVAEQGGLTLAASA